MKYIIRRLELLLYHITLETGLFQRIFVIPTSIAIASVYAIKSVHVTYLQGGPKLSAPCFLYALTLRNINRFSKLFHCQNREKICSNTITKDPTTP